MLHTLAWHIRMQENEVFDERIHELVDEQNKNRTLVLARSNYFGLYLESCGCGQFRCNAAFHWTAGSSKKCILKYSKYFGSK